MKRCVALQTGTAIRSHNLCRNRCFIQKHRLKLTNTGVHQLLWKRGNVAAMSKRNRLEPFFLAVLDYILPFFPCWLQLFDRIDTSFVATPTKNNFGCVWRTPSVYVIDSCVLDHLPSKMHKLTSRDIKFQHIPLPFRLMIFPPVQKIDFSIRNGRLLFSLPDHRESSYQIGRL